MKKDIHPIYYKDAIVHCNCGKIFKMGATKPEMRVEVCSSCHPFYTGKDKVLDAAGRVEKFKKRLAKKSSHVKASADKQK
jgi:large subunit ribosomal protein L31